jgi:hypothetical protein
MYLDAVAKHRRDSKDAAILNHNAERPGPPNFFRSITKQTHQPNHQK